jgi:hypothetical protein
MTPPLRLLALGVALLATSLAGCGIKDAPLASAICVSATTDAACGACCARQQSNSHRVRDGACQCRYFYWYHEQ